MKRLHLAVYGIIAAALCGLPVWAATPTDIAFSAKKTTLFGAEYHVYNVRCSDGNKQVISAWDKKQKWCVGTKDKQCFTTQLKAASAACR